MKSRGDLLKEACDKSGLLLTVAKAYNGFADGYAAAEKKGLDQAAAAYDKAVAADLPDDVDAFVREVEARRAHGTSEANVCSLIAIVREQAVRIAELTSAAAAVLGESVETRKERDALRDRLAKLEAAAMSVLAVDWIHGEESECPHRYCDDGCDGGEDCEMDEPDGIGCDDCEMGSLHTLQKLLNEKGGA